MRIHLDSIPNCHCCGQFTKMSAICGHFSIVLDMVAEIAQLKAQLRAYRAE
jgi:hypothetical protein